MKDDRQVKRIRAKQLEEYYGIDRITAWRWGMIEQRHLLMPFG